MVIATLAREYFSAFHAPLFHLPHIRTRFLNLTQSDTFHLVADRPTSSKDESARPFQVKEPGQTLAAVVRQMRQGASWTDAKKLVAKRCVQVNGNLCTDDARRLTVGDIVHLVSPGQFKTLDERDIKLRHIDEDLLIVEKPAGVTSTRHVEERDWSDRRRQVQPTLDEYLPPLLMSHFGKLRLDNSPGCLSDAIRNASKLKVRWPQPIAVHRLDRETSGLMVFARHRTAEQLLVTMFKQHTIDRRYRAVVLGDCPDMTINSYLGKVGEKRSSVGKDAPGAQHAVTHVKKISVQKINGEVYSLVECKLETGRTHQIRIHLSEKGHAVCGDKIYRSNLKDASAAPRHALHSFSIAFTHPTSAKPVKFEMDWPKDLTAWAKTLGFSL
jgi:23S rRNA pseudouridine1911/1915/1917 synthase